MTARRRTPASTQLRTTPRPLRESPKTWIVDGGTATRPYARTGSPAGPVVALQMTAAVRDCLAEADCWPRLLDITLEKPVWLPPPDAEALFTFAASWNRAPAQAPPGWPFGLKWIQMASAGVDVLPAWAYDGVTVTCARGITAEPIAEFVVAAIFDLEKSIRNLRPRGPGDVHRVANEHTVLTQSMRTVRGQTVGLVGYGAIGKAIAAKALALGMHVKAARRTPRPSESEPVEFVASVRGLASAVDHLVLCAPATPETHHLVDAAVFDAMKPGMHLINVARGSLVDHRALARALDQGRVRRASLDVTEPEPLPEGHPFYSDPRVVLTPHVAWYAPDHFDLLAGKLLANLERFAHATPLEDVVDPKAGY